MTSHARSLLVVTLLGAAASAAGCSGGDFDVSSTTTDAEITANETSTSDDASTDDTSGGATEGGAAEGGAAESGSGGADGGSGNDAPVVSADVAPVDAGCTAPEPAVACTTPVGAYFQQFDSPDSYSWLPPRIGPAGSFAVSYELAVPGRHEKLILRLRTYELAGAADAGEAGTVTLTAYRMPCPGHLVPLGKVSKQVIVPSTTGQSYSFYFRDAEFLPSFPTGTRLAFVLTTESTRYGVEVAGNNSSTVAPPQGLQWYVRTLQGWQRGQGMVSAQAWMTPCTQ